MMAPVDLLKHFDVGLGAALALLRVLVEMESCSSDKPAIDRLAVYLAGEFAARGAEAEVLPSATSGNALRAVWRGTGSARPIMVLGHLDTVWPRGTVVMRPFALREGQAFGPGVLDMKSGILLCLLVCGAFRDQHQRLAGDVIFFFTPDEESGTAAGLPLLQAAVSQCRAVLCLEPPLPGGKAKTSRNGVGSFQLRVTGVGAHAGIDHEKGANAILELSRQVIRLHRMTCYDKGNTVSVGTIRGGSAVNVVPDQAEAEVDFRFRTLAEGQRLERRIRQLHPQDSRCRLQWQGGINRPPLKRTPEGLALYHKAKAIAAAIGMDLGEGETRGGSDGSYTAALGIPTLDGLGVEGDGAHAAHEHILISDIPRRAALLSLLAQELLP
jgi:glutamate carboxypeptidase